MLEGLFWLIVTPIYVFILAGITMSILSWLYDGTFKFWKKFRDR